MLVDVSGLARLRQKLHFCPKMPQICIGGRRKGAFRARSPHHLPKPVDYAHQTTCSSQHHIFYPTIGGWARQSKAPLPIEMASFSKVQIERGAFSLPVLSACAVRRCHVPLHSSLQHHIIMMHVTSRVIWNRNLSSRQP